MKKQVLVLTMCLALTATYASAGTNVTQKSTVRKTAVAAPVQAPQTKIPASALMPSLAKPGQQPQFINKEEAKKRFESAKAKEREFLYTALNFTAEQKSKAEVLDIKTKAGAGKVIKKVQSEARKLRDLQNKHASKFAIWKQKLALRKAKDDMKKYFENSRKDFESIMTKEQKAKFKIIDDAKKKEMEQFRKEHKFGGHKPGPDAHMGPPPSGMGPNGPQGPEPMGPPSPEDKK
jgi:hypothetical protein